MQINMKKKKFFSFLQFFWHDKKKGGGSKEYMSSQQVEVLKARLEELMEQKQPFLKPGYSIKDMSNDLDIPAYQFPDLSIETSACISTTSLINPGSNTVKT